MIHRPPDPIPPLFACPPARRNAPPGTSEAAADQIAGHAAQQRQTVLVVIAQAGARGATDAEIEAASGLRAQSVSPRRGELVKAGQVVDSGRRRRTPRGRSAAVWVTVEHAPRRGEGGTR